MDIVVQVVAPLSKKYTYDQWGKFKSSWSFQFFPLVTQGDLVDEGASGRSFPRVGGLFEYAVMDFNLKAWFLAGGLKFTRSYSNGSVLTGYAEIVSQIDVRFGSSAKNEFTYGQVKRGRFFIGFWRAG